MSKQLVVLDTPADQAVCCAPIAEVSLDAVQATELARMFKALGDPIRLRLLSRWSTPDASRSSLRDARRRERPASRGYADNPMTNPVGST
jgi:ArsR family transcriptional regulator